MIGLVWVTEILDFFHSRTLKKRSLIILMFYEIRMGSGFMTQKIFKLGQLVIFKNCIGKLLHR